MGQLLARRALRLLFSGVKSEDSQAGQTAFTVNAEFPCLKSKKPDCKRTKEIKKQTKECFFTARNLALLK